MGSMAPTTQTYVGSGGDYTQETTYRYVGMGAGSHGMQPAAVSETVIKNVMPFPVRGPNCCCLILIPLLLSLLLLPLLLGVLMSGTSMTTTPRLELPTPPPELPTTTKKTTTKAAP